MSIRTQYLIPVFVLSSAVCEREFYDSHSNRSTDACCTTPGVVLQAFYYGPYTGGGTCSLDSPNHVGVPPEIEGVSLTVAMNVKQFEMGSCGMCIQITGETRTTIRRGHERSRVAAT